MKAIIKGFRYDTERAELVGEAQHGHRGDLNYATESLYVTPVARRYFLAGQGGPMSRYARSCGQNQWTGGSRIIPLTRDEGLAWAEANLSPEACEAAFADCIQEA